MPRPKVKPENRKRSICACIPCKTSKIRCDAADPCGPCSKRERAGSCVYPANNRSTGARKRRRLSTASGPVETDDSLPNAPLLGQDSDADGQRARRDEAVEGGMSNSSEASESDEPVSCQTEGRMLFNSKGEKLYVGENASLSFLQFLRSCVRASMGPSSFTEHQWKDSMLEISVARDESPVDSAHSQVELQALIQLYREASAGILDIFTSFEIDTLFKQHLRSSLSNGDDERSRGEKAALNMMLAIGSQCCGQDYDATRYFSSAQQYALGSVCDPSLSLVRVFLLMAFYLLGAIHRNGAYMYLGIATQAACALGLHRRDSHKDMPPQEGLSRERTWKSLIILDTIVSTVLGRPRSVVVQHNASDGVHSEMFANGDSILDADRPSWLSTQAVGTICLHIIELEQQIGRTPDSPTVEKFLARLQSWNRTLPPELTRHSLQGKTLSSYEKELFIGATHVACSYYFAIILVTRPFLIAHLVSQIRRRRRPSMDSNNSAAPELAQACIDAAKFMADACAMAIRVSTNMRLLKAWSFAGGLVLGFSLFAYSFAEPDQEIVQGFRKSVTVLEHLADSSPQAGHYFHILSTFSDAIDARRAQLRGQRRNTIDRFVTQIITTDFHDGSALMSVSPPSVPLERATTTSSNHTGLDGSLNGVFDPTAYDISDMSQPLEDLADLPFISDNLYIDWGVWPGM